MYTEWDCQNQVKNLLVCLSHCKIACDSPCCVKICGEDNHCNVNVGTHEHISDSEEEQIEKQY